MHVSKIRYKLACVYSEDSNQKTKFSALRNIEPLATYGAPIKDSEQTLDAQLFFFLV